MLEKIITQLQKTNAGVSRKVLEFFAKQIELKITEENQIEGAITELGTQVKDYSDLLQSESDRRVTDALKKAKAEPSAATEPTKDGKDKEDGNDLLKIIAQTLQTELAPLKEQIQGFKIDKTKSELMKKAIEVGIPTRLVDKYQIADGFTIEQAITDLTAESDELRRVYLAETLGDGVVQRGVPHGSTSKPTKAELDAVMNDIKL